MKSAVSRGFHRGLIATVFLPMAGAAHAEDTKADGREIIDRSTAVLREYFSEPRLEAVRNLMGAPLPDAEVPAGSSIACANRSVRPKRSSPRPNWGSSSGLAVLASAYN